MCVCACICGCVCPPPLFPFSLLSYLPPPPPPPHTHTCALSWRVSWTARLDRCDALVKDLRVTGASSAGQTPPSVSLQPPALGAVGRHGWELTPSQPHAACKISGLKKTTTPACACKQCTFRSYNRSTLNIVRLDEDPFPC